jgi:O-methyltransferase
MIQIAKQAINGILGIAGFQLSKVEKNKKPAIYNPDVFPIELDAADEEIFQYVRNNDLTMVTNARLYSTLLSCKYVIEENVAGDFVECGVWRGGNAILAADVFKRMAPTRSVFCFDTYSGMTTPTEADVNLNGHAAGDLFKEKVDGWALSRLDEVKANFRQKRLTENVRFIEGDVLNTLSDPGNLPISISVLRLDTDWYESTKMELEVLYPLLSVGGVLIIDDYGHWGGARKAVEEYFSDRRKPYFQATDYSGRCAVKVL